MVISMIASGLRNQASGIRAQESGLRPQKATEKAQGVSPWAFSLYV
jgi:hypothetical protein